MFLIKRLWVDTLENTNAYGYTPIGVVSTKEQADRICNLEYIPKGKYPWPLDYAFEFDGDSVPRFVAKEMDSLDDLSLEDLNAIEGKSFMHL